MIKNYLVYDEYGIDRVLCMNCGVVVAKRSYVELPARNDHTKKVPAAILKRLGNWRQKRMLIEEGGKRNAYVDVILCADCVHKPLDRGNLMRMIVNGFCKEKPDREREIRKLYKKRKLVEG